MNKEKKSVTNHKLLDQREAPTVSLFDTTDQEEPHLSPEKEALLNSVAPTESERNGVGRLNQMTERLAPLPDIEKIPDMVSEAQEADELLEALQEMAGGVSKKDQDQKLAGEKLDLLDSLLSSDVAGALNADKPPVHDKVFTEEFVGGAELVVEGNGLVPPVNVSEEPELIPEKSVALDKVFSDEFVGGAELVVEENGLIPPVDVPMRQIFTVPGSAALREVIAGLSIWEDCATACLLKHKQGKLVVTHAAHVEFPEKAGDEERVVLLRKMWRQGGFPTRSVWVNVHASSFLQKHVTYDLEGEQLEAAMLRDAEQSLQGLGGDSAVDWAVGPRLQGGVEGMVFAIPGWERDYYISLLQKAGLLVCGMSAPQCDLARTLEMARPYPEKTLRPTECVISFSRTGADIVIVYGAGNFFSRTVYSRVASWHENMQYLYECVNDAVGYFASWTQHPRVTTLLLTGLVPDVHDLGGELLRETGIFAEIWNPVQESQVLSMGPTAKRGGVSGTMLAGAVGLALMRG